jgi:putative addiction module CopG family antidote
MRAIVDCRVPAPAIVYAAMKVELTARHKRYVDEKVKSGAYGSADEVVREGLRLLEAEDERVRRLAWLQAEVDKGFTGPFTTWSSKDSDRVRRLVARHVRRRR